MPGGLCSFNKEWLTGEHKEWLREFTEDKRKAKCLVCKSVFDIGNMGSKALESHSKGKKHTENLRLHRTGRATGIENYTVRQSSTTAMQTSAHAAAPGPSGTSISSYLSNDDVSKAEILWTLHTIKSHNSYKSNENIDKVMRTMFPDSQIATKFTCGEKKTSYICCFGLAPYIQSQIVRETTKEFVYLFDETLCQTTQTKQLDAYIRKWDDNKHLVVTRFLRSIFMGHGTANDLLQHFHECCRQLNERNILQISMDGPNVNWRFYNDLKQELDNPDSPKLLDLGSCGLHIVHNAFKSGFEATEWCLQEFLKCLYKFFKDTPARREDYERITGSGTFPMKFCVSRWVENVRVVNRALDVLQPVQQFLKDCGKAAQKTRNFKKLQEGYDDPLLKAKLLFFLSVAKQFETFLVRYQTDKPMVPHLCGDLCTLFRGLLTRFVQRAVMKEATTPLKLIKVDCEKQSVCVNYSDVDIGYAADKEVKECIAAGKVSEKMVMEFRMECKAMLKKATSKLLDKSPLKYSLVRNLASLDPCNIAKDAQKSKEQFRRVVQKLDEAKRVNSGDCDSIIWEYNDFVDSIETVKYMSYEPYSEKSRLDNFFHEEIGCKKQYKLLFSVVKMCLCLSHGQATVERGFSVNAELIVENLQEESIMAQRIVCDFINYSGGVLEVPLKKELLVSVRGAHQKYLASLEEKRRSKDREEKRKELKDQLEDVQKRKKTLEKEVQSLTESADTLAQKAEVEQSLRKLTESNALRKRSGEKAEELASVMKDLEDKRKKLRLF